MRARLAVEFDRSRVIRLAHTAQRELAPAIPFDHGRANDTFNGYILNAHPTIFVLDDDGDITGMLLAGLYEYAFASGVFVSQDVLYVRPDKRGPRAAVLLLDAFRAWGDKVGAREKVYGILSERKPDKFVRFIQRFTGARLVGSYLKEGP